MLPFPLICLVHLHQYFFFDPGVQLWYHLCLTPLISSARGYCCAVEGAGTVLRALLCLQKNPVNSHGMPHMRPHWLKFSSFIGAVLLESEEGKKLSLPGWGRREGASLVFVTHAVGSSATYALGAGWALFRTIYLLWNGSHFSVSPFTTSPPHVIASCFMSELERDVKTGEGGASLQALLPLREIPLPCVVVQLQFHQHDTQLLYNISQSNSPCLHAPYLHLHTWFGALGLPPEPFCCQEAPSGWG